MNRADLTCERLAELIDRFRSQRIAVLGDFFLDKYLDVDPAIAEVSVESGKIAHQVDGVRTSPGAAGTVVSNLASLGAGTLHAIGLTGDDGEGYDLRKCLQQMGCTTDHLHAVTGRHTPQYLKPRDIEDTSLEGEHERYDTKNRTTTPPDCEQRIIESVDALLPDLDALIIQDQIERPNCGVVTDKVRQALSARARNHPGVLFWADSRRRIRLFRNIVIKPNQFEAVGKEDPVPGDEVPLDELADTIKQLRYEIGAPVCATCGQHGMIVSDPELTAAPGVSVEGETDPTGAGDSVTAGTVLAMCAGAELPEAAIVGNLVASITVQQLAVTGTAGPEELGPRLEVWRRQHKEQNDD